MIQVIILDFDGVIVESVNIKTDVYRQLFSAYPEHLDSIMRYHLRNNAASRLVKLRYIHEQILHRPFDDTTREQALQRFSHLSFERVVHCSFVPGAREFLQRFSPFSPLYLVSATPQEELRRIVTARQLEGFFRGVFGAPGTKLDHMRRILAQERVTPEEAVMIGDHSEDWRAATSLGLHFLGRQNEDPFEGTSAQVYVDMYAVAAALTSLVENAKERASSAPRRTLDGSA